MAFIVRSRLIQNNPELLELFLNSFKALSGNPVEYSYLARANVRGFFKEGELVAGYVSNSRAPLRCTTWIPENVRSDLLSRNIPGGEDSCCELTCMWKDRSKVSIWEMNWIYVVAIFDGYCSGKPNVIGGSFVKKVADGQTRIFNQTVYSGPSDFKKGSQCAVYFATRFHMVWGIIREIFIEFKKHVTRQNIFRMRRS